MKFLKGLGLFSVCISILLICYLGIETQFCNRFGRISTGYRNTPPPFFLGVTLKFRDEEDKTYFKSIFRDIAEYVKRNEPTTISYELYESDKISTEVFILERYANKAAYTDIHRVSKQFIFFREKLNTLKPVIVGGSYIESGIGFV